MPANTNESAIPAPTLQSILDDSAPKKRGKNREESTGYSLARRMLLHKIEASPGELESPLKSFCEKHGLDYGECVETAEYYLAEGVGNPAMTNAIERLAVDPWRIDLSDASISNTENTLYIATLCVYLMEEAEGGVFYISCEQIAPVLGISTRHCRRMIKNLIRIGLLEQTEDAVWKGSKSEHNRCRIFRCLNVQKDANVRYNFKAINHYLSNSLNTQKNESESVSPREEDRESLFPARNKTAGNIGSPEQIISESIPEQKTGPQGIIPRQELMPELPERRVNRPENVPDDMLPQCPMCNQAAYRCEEAGTREQHEAEYQRIEHERRTRTPAHDKRDAAYERKVQTRSQNEAAAKRFKDECVRANKKRKAGEYQEADMPAQYADIVCRFADETTAYNRKSAEKAIREHGIKTVGSLFHGILESGKAKSPLGMMLHELRQTGTAAAV